MSDAPTGMIAEAQAAGRTLLSEVESKALLAAAGVPVVEARLATSAQETASIASEIGFPVVLKVASTDIAHKSDAGGVLVNIGDAEAANAGYERIVADVALAAPDASVDGVSVQRQADPGTEVIVGMTSDPQFGPVVMFGLGGIFVEALRDVSFRVAPLSRADAEEMIDEIRGHRVLTGLRGKPPLDREALIGAILSVSELVTRHQGRIEELDINPLLLFPEGARAVDALITRSKEPTD
jgi:succinyl-CoA synthetase beta subunit